MIEERIREKEREREGGGGGGREGEITKDNILTENKGRTTPFLNFVCEHLWMNMRNV